MSEKYVYDEKGNFKGIIKDVPDYRRSSASSTEEKVKGLIFIYLLLSLIGWFWATAVEHNINVSPFVIQVAHLVKTLCFPAIVVWVIILIVIAICMI